MLNISAQFGKAHGEHGHLPRHLAWTLARRHAVQLAFGFVEPSSQPCEYCIVDIVVNYSIASMSGGLSELK